MRSVHYLSFEGRVSLFQIGNGRLRHDRLPQCCIRVKKNTKSAKRLLTWIKDARPEFPGTPIRPSATMAGGKDAVFRNSGLEPPSATVLTVSLHLYMRLIETGRWPGLVPGSI